MFRGSPKDCVAMVAMVVYLVGSLEIRGCGFNNEHNAAF